MSYILDALKKAQAERDLGQVPAAQVALRADLPTGGPTAVQGSTGTRSLVPILGAALVVVTVGTLAWNWWPRKMAASTVGVAPEPVGAANPPSRAIAEPVGPVGKTDPVRPVPTPATPTVLPPVLPTPPAPTAAAIPSAAPKEVVAVSPAPAAPASATVPVVALDALDAPTRARLPRLVLGGAIHATERSQRMVILDGQVLREGETVAPGVRLQSIEPQGVVLLLDERFGNRRVRIVP